MPPAGREAHGECPHVLLAFRCTPARGGTCPALPSAPCSPYCGRSWRRVMGTMARWAPKPHGTPGASSGTADPRGHSQSQFVCRQLLSTSILPSQGHRPASGSYLAAAPAGAARPRARHRAAGSWLERAQGFRTPAAPRPRGGRDLPTATRAAPTPLPPGLAGPVPLATWLLPPAWITSLSVFFNFS